ERGGVRSELKSMRRIILLTAALGVAGTAVAAPQAPDQSRRVEDARAATERRMQDVRLKESRYQIGQIERLLEGAVEHGATVIKDRLAALMPSDMLLTENAR